ncbi:MAG: hypothetical protein H6709_14110 [Kofleriaceae bacterium]|nr:hypothetical protein [Kofleriaceae bacterium]MCB9573215.1 hypothetical protein [Kofleriaceae bacterium]
MARTLGPQLAVVLLVAAVAAAGCGGPSGGAAKALDRYGQALRDKNYERAYELMSSSFRAKVSREEFVRMMRDNPREVGETTRRLDKHPSRMEISAEFEYGLGDSMRLVQEGGVWKIASNPLTFYDQSTPRATLRSMLRAYRLERWDVMLRFVPDKYRQKMDVEKMQRQFQGAKRQEMEVLMNMLEANIDEAIQEKGNEARMSYGERYEVKFVREDGAWKIKDLD